jgi:HlyD family secretion protein
MRRIRPVVMIVAAVAVVALLGWGLVLRGNGEGQTLSGYVEGDLVYLAAPVSGAVQTLYVQEGERVAAGAATFLIDPQVPRAQAESAAAALAAAEAHADDLRKGQRAQEQAVYDAQLAAAEAQLRQAQADYDRIAPLVARGIYAPARLDQQRAARDTARAQVETVRRQRAVAALGARSDAIAAADQQAAQARGGLSGAEAVLRTLSPPAPTAARVQQIFFRQGEWAPANQPVLALLPDARIKLRFFVPERSVSLYRPGTTVQFGCDGCPGLRTARIRWVSATAEFTPPVLYSRGSRDRLVFMVEATPEDTTALNPGLPVDVVPLDGAR